MSKFTPPGSLMTLMTRDTRDTIRKISTVKKLPENSCSYSEKVVGCRTRSFLSRQSPQKRLPQVKGPIT